jgi:hypothetical protein
VSLDVGSAWWISTASVLEPETSMLGGAVNAKKVVSDVFQVVARVVAVIVPDGRLERATSTPLR